MLFRSEWKINPDKQAYPEVSTDRLADVVNAVSGLKKLAVVTLTDDRSQHREFGVVDPGSDAELKEGTEGVGKRVVLTDDQRHTILDLIVGKAKVTDKQTTAEELQNRAREFLDRQAAELDARRVELGVLDELKEIDGLTPAMLVALGEAGLKSVEDLAGCDTDELIGWTERKAGGAVKHKGAFSDLEVSAEEANDLIMKARVRAGWIEAPVEAETEEEGEVEA